MTFPAPRSATWLALSATLALQAACSDLPTGSDSFQLEADGELWTAVVAPAGLPTAETWLAFAPASPPPEAPPPA